MLISNNESNLIVNYHLFILCQGSAFVKYPEILYYINCPILSGNLILAKMGSAVEKFINCLIIFMHYTQCNLNSIIVAAKFVTFQQTK